MDLEGTASPAFPMEWKAEPLVLFFFLQLYEQWHLLHCTQWISVSFPNPFGHEEEETLISEEHSSSLRSPVLQGEGKSCSSVPAGPWLCWAQLWHCCPQTPCAVLGVVKEKRTLGKYSGSPLWPLGHLCNFLLMSAVLKVKRMEESCSPLPKWPKKSAHRSSKSAQKPHSWWVTSGSANCSHCLTMNASGVWNKWNILE